MITDPNNIVSELSKLLARGYGIVCVGNDLRADDRAGLEVCRTLAERGYPVIECPGGLEMCTHEVAERGYRGIIVVDAAIIEGADIALCSVEEIQEALPLSTHSIPMHLVVKYLREYCGIEDARVLGIRVEDLSFSNSMSEGTRRRVELATQLLVQAFEEAQRRAS